LSRNADRQTRVGQFELHNIELGATALLMSTENQEEEHQ